MGTDKQLEPANADALRIQSDLAQFGLNVSVGDQFISGRDYQGVYFRIEGFYRHEKYGDRVIVRFGSASGWNEKTEEKSLDDFRQYTMEKAIPFTATIEQMEAAAIASLSNISALDTSDGEISEDDSNALIVSGGMDYCKDVQARTQKQIEKVEAIRRIVAAKVNALGSIVSKMQSEVKIIMKVVGALELYLGVYEEVVQIRIGEPAKMDEVISFRQQILYMDEEVGDPRKRPNGQYGIDFQSVEDFDAWVIVPENCDKMLPEKKGVVAVRPSRQKRSYSKNPWLDAKANGQNQMCYLLCRNGDNLYRVWTSLTMGHRLFPSLNEMELILNGEDGSSSGWFSRRDAKEKAFSYKQKAMLLAGIIDRTEIFLPMKRLVNLFDPDTYDGMIRFIDDDEPALQDGKHVPYKEWKAEINGAIERGSRVLICEFSQYHDLFERGSQRFKRWYQHKMSVPPAPSPGVYTVNEVVKREKEYQSDSLYIMYNPGDEVGCSSWEWNPHTRKNRLSFALYRGDSFVLNYDRVSLEDVEYYIDCRFERQKYLSMIPVLWEIREQQMKEIEWEEMFVDLVVARNDCDAETVRACVDWYKYKNIWKRPVREDDAKALRMIERKLARILEGKISAKELK